MCSCVTQVSPPLTSGFDGFPSSRESSPGVAYVIWISISPRIFANDKDLNDFDSIDRIDFSVFWNLCYDGGCGTTCNAYYWLGLLVSCYWVTYIAARTHRPRNVGGGTRGRTVPVCSTVVLGVSPQVRQRCNVLIQPYT